MPLGLKRYYGAKHLHFLTFSCYQRLPLLAGRRARDTFLSVLEQVRRRYGMVVVGYVVMPEHVHLLIREPRRGTPSTVVQALKQSVARKLLRKSAQPTLWEPLPHFWQKRFYDFNVWSGHKWMEKLNYMHDNPVRRGLVPSPELWAWSSYRAYACGQAGVVKLNDWPKPEFVARENSNSRVPGTHPAKTAQGGAPKAS